MAEADRPTRRDPRIGRKCLGRILQEFADFPGFVMSLTASIPRRTQELHDHGRIASIRDSSHFARE
jgi:hypothetical protein